MTESLYIKNFGAIEDACLDNIRPLTILIGESGTGKSTIMKLLSIFRWIYKRVNVRSILQLSNVTKTNLSFDFKNLLKVSGIDEFLKNDTVIVYTRDNYELRYEKGLKASSRIAQTDLSLDKVCFISDKRSMIPDLLEGKVSKSVVGYYLQDTYDNFRKASESIKEMMIEYLGIKLKIEKKNNRVSYKIISEDDNQQFALMLRNASSGMMNVTPLTLIVEYLVKNYDFVKAANGWIFEYLKDNDKLSDFRSDFNIGSIKNRNLFFLIEEPELSLDPISQKALIDFLLSRCSDTSDYVNASLIIATHSPYILNYLNLLIARHENDKDTPLPSIEFEDVDAYEVAEGTIRQLKIEEKKLIDTRVMSDPISDIYRMYNSIKGNNQ